MSASHSTRYGQGWRECQQQKREFRAAEGIICAAIAGALIWAVFGAIVVVLWGVML